MLYDDPGHSLLHNIRRSPVTSSQESTRQVSPLPAIIPEFLGAHVLKSCSCISEGRAVLSVKDVEFLSEQVSCSIFLFVDICNWAPSSRSPVLKMHDPAWERTWSVLNIYRDF